MTPSLFLLMWQAYWVDEVNRVFNGLYLSLLVGAAYNLASLWGHQQMEGYYLLLLPLCFVTGYWVLGAWLDLQRLDATRASLNSWLVETFRFFDLADNPRVIHELGLAHLLCSPTRQVGKGGSAMIQRGMIQRGAWLRSLCSLDSHDADSHW